MSSNLALAFPAARRLALAKTTTLVTAMGRIQIHPRAEARKLQHENPLPQLLQTPSGLALLEIQGTLNSTCSHNDDNTAPEIPIGHLSFPLYDPQDTSGDTSWQKRVYLFVGENQRLTGELKKLPNAIAVLQKRERESNASEDLEIAAIIQHKLVFNHRPEPFGTSTAVDSAS